MGNTGTDHPVRLTPPGRDAWEFEVPATPPDVSEARRAVARYLAQRGVPAGLVADVELVTSELVTNALHHGRRGDDHPGVVGVVIRIRPDRDVSVTVTNAGPAGAIPPVSSWRIPSDPVVSGRGLGIVRRLCADVVVLGDGTRSEVRCRCPWTTEEGAT